MYFAGLMAWRDSRASRRRLFLFSLSVVLGIAALVAVGSLSANLSQAIQVQAKALLGADLFVTSPAPLDAAVTRYVEGLGGQIAHESMFSSMMVFPQSGGGLRLVQVRAIEGAFPFYGDFVTDPPEAAEQLRGGGAVVVIEDTLMRQFGVRVGDRVRLGKGEFTVAGALRKIPGESAAVGMLAPRAFIPLSQLPATGLVGAGALARYRLMLRLPDRVDADAVAHEMRQRFASARLGFDTVAQRQREMGRALTNIDAFLTLVGFVALFLGGIGVASALHVYAQQKIATVAVLRCLGSGARQAFSVYLLQGLALGLVGAVMGAALGITLQSFLPKLVAGLLPFPVDFFISWPAVGRGMAAGVIICLLFALLPLLAIRRVPPLAALRAAVADDPAARFDPLRLAVWIAIAAAVSGFAVAQTDSWRMGLGFAGALGSAFAILAGLAGVVAWAARRFPATGLPYVVRQGVANLHRPNNRTVLLLVSLGLGTFLVLTLFLARTTLLREVADTGGGQRPNLLFFDIQEDQIGPLNRITREQGAEVVDQAPLVTMKIASVRGVLVETLLRDRGLRRDDDSDDGGDRRSSTRLPAWALRRDYRSTFRSVLNATERVTEGHFVGKVVPGSGPIPISVEESLATDLRLHLGDRIDWDVQGVAMASTVASIRTVEWRRLQPSFFVVFPEGALNEAPRTYIAAVRAADPETSARVQKAVVGALPNVTAIDLELLVETLDSIFSKVAFILEFMALFTVATGILVLASAVYTGRFQRIRETVLLRTLGATGLQIRRILWVEYAILGLLAGAVGGFLAVAADGLLARFVFHTQAAAPAAQLAVAVAAVAAVTLTTGALSNRGIAKLPPLAVLREEA